MKKVHRVGLAFGVGASLALTSLAPEQSNIVAASGNCLSLDYGYNPEESNTPATGTISNLGAFTLGVLDRSVEAAKSFQA